MTVDATTILVSLLSSIGGGAIVALVNHWLTSSRERTKRLAELTIQRRIEAYRRLERAVRPGKSADPDSIARNKLKDDLESAFADTLLLGTRTEIELALKTVDILKSDNNAFHFVPLLEEFRSNLRRDLRLEKTEIGSIHFLRIDREND